MTRFVQTVRRHISGNGSLENYRRRINGRLFDNGKM